MCNVMVMVRFGVENVLINPSLSSSNGVWFAADIHRRQIVKLISAAHCRHTDEEGSSVYRNAI